MYPAPACIGAPFEEGMTMTCPNCGAQTTPDMKFCISCGTKLPEAEAQAAAPQEEAAPEIPLEVQQPTVPYQTTQAQDPQHQAQPYVPPASQPQQPYTPPADQAQQPYTQVPPTQGVPQAAPIPQQYMYEGAIYPMTSTDRMLRLINFICCCVSIAISFWAIIPLAWMIPVTYISWGIYKGKKRNTVAFGVCTLLFTNIVGGILLLCSNKDQ